MMRIAIILITSAGLLGVLAAKVCVLPQGMKTKFPDLEEQWNHQQYGLDDDETLRFIPQSPGRWQVAYAVESSVFGRFARSSEDGDIRSAILKCGWFEMYSLEEPDYVIDDGLASIPVIGDWLVRTDAPEERRMKALQSILSQSTGRHLVFQKALATRDVIVISGKWGFRPLDFSSLFSLTVHLYTDDSGLDTPIHRNRQGADYLLRRLHSFSYCYVIDETNGQIPSFIHWQDELPMHCERTPGQPNPETSPLLDNLAKQTSLQFLLTTRKVPVWFVEERRRK